MEKKIYFLADNGMVLEVPLEEVNFSGEFETRGITIQFLDGTTYNIYMRLPYEDPSQKLPHANINIYLI